MQFDPGVCVCVCLFVCVGVHAQYLVTVSKHQKKKVKTIY